jgi:putative PIN family toxin of toxin-antitoxin system
MTAAAMRLVFDTNVLVSALLNPGRTPDLAVRAARRAGSVALVDARIEEEYRDVLARPKFSKIDPTRKDILLDEIFASCERVTVTEAYAGALIDPDDRVFIEVALAGRADVLVTGNLKHYPSGCPVAVISPAALLAQLTGA